MGMELARAEKARVELVWTVKDEHLQPFGIVHGGVYAGAVETACSLGGMLNADGAVVAGVENHTSFLKSVREGRLTAVAVPVHVGRSSQLWQADVRDEDDNLVATGRVRLMVLRQEQKRGGQ